MTLQEKLKEIASPYEKVSYKMIARRSAVKMHEWDKQQFIEWAAGWLKRNAEKHTCLDFNDGYAKAIYDEDELVADFKKYAEEQL